jgi:hypothetical protein
MLSTEFRPKVKVCTYDKCGREFMPVRPMQAVCSPRCAGSKVKADNKAKKAAERAETKQRKESFKKLYMLIAEAQDAFNEFIRLRDRHKGCFVCGKQFNQSIPGHALHAGHVRSRGAAGHLRFHEDNCMGECEGCNGPRGAKPHQIEAGAVGRIGQEKFDALKNSNEPHKWTKDEVRGIRDTYRARVKAMKVTDGKA